jgi:hypothetical protein
MEANVQTEQAKTAVYFENTGFYVIGSIEI